MNKQKAAVELERERGKEWKFWMESFATQKTFQKWFSRLEVLTKLKFTITIRGGA